MPKQPRKPPGERPCAGCGTSFTPVVGPRGGQPPKRCPSCHGGHVVSLRHRAEDPVPAVAEILADRMRASLVAAEVRDRLLNVATLLSAEADGSGSETVSACAAELRAICGIATPTARRPVARRASR